LEVHMGQWRDAGQMFRGVSYGRFSSEDVRTAMTKKVEKVMAKVKERKERVRLLMLEHHISNEMVTGMVIQFMKDQQEGRQRANYSLTLGQPDPGAPRAEEHPFVPAGVVSNLVTEKQLIESEAAEVRRMTLILRNLRDEEAYYAPDTGARLVRKCVHTLNDDEIEYLGF